MTQEDLNRMQDVQIELMDEIHRICEENNITYYLIAGSLLGAVRHGGFIPWDLDIDIAMTRKDYDKFKQVCLNSNSNRYFYRDYTNTKNYIRPHAMFCKRNTWLTIKNDNLNPKAENLGIFIDIFPLDTAPMDEAKRKKQAEKLLKIRQFKGYRIPYSYSQNKLKRRIHYMVSALFSFISVEKLNKYQQKVMCRYNGEDSELVCSMASKYAYEKETMPFSMYGKPTLVDFSGRQYYAPEKYEKYLTVLYGDYMQLPPVEEREANLAIFCDVKFE